MKTFLASFKISALVKSAFYGVKRVPAQIAKNKNVRIFLLVLRKKARYVTSSITGDDRAVRGSDYCNSTACKFVFIYARLCEKTALYLVATRSR
jgi:hypothetical protein